MLLPIRLVRGHWPAWLERRARRFLWRDPLVILDERVSPADFRKAMFAVHVGGTWKITWNDRHRFADDLLLRHVDPRGLHVADVGASDGSTSVDLLERLDGFASFAITDNYVALDWVRVGRSVAFYDHDGGCVLVAGRRFLAWPAQSRPVRALLAPWLAAAGRRPRRTVTLLNPEARRIVAADPRVSFRRHDVFAPWAGPPPDVVRVANLLRRLYFSDVDIARALRVLHAGLARNGHLVVVDHHREPGIPARAGLYRRTERGFALVEETPHPPEISSLVLALRVPAGTQAARA